VAFDFPASPANGQIFNTGTTTYTWNGVAWMTHGGDPGAGIGNPADFVLKAGDTMTGFLTLSADPVNPLHAATKQYVDAKFPPPDTPGEALVANPAIVPEWGAPINGGVF
jgi:hypothetical protein